MSDIKNLPESRLRSEYPLLQGYVQKDLRRRFDEAYGDPIDEVEIIEQARTLGITSLFDQMKKEFCSDADCKYFWTLHQDHIDREREIQKEMVVVPVMDGWGLVSFTSENTEI